MIRTRYVMFSLALLSGGFAQAKEFYVAKDGSDRNSGTIGSPFLTIERGIESMSPGDILYIREGRYFEEIKLNRIEGEISRPYIIEAYNGEEVVLDGTKPIDSKWEKYEGDIYKTKINFPIWQLFVGEKSMCAARWPNGDWHDGSLWDNKKSMCWPQGGEKGRYEHEGIREIPGSLKGATLITNSASFTTYQTPITEHQQGDLDIHYDKTKVKYHRNASNQIGEYGFFIECSKYLIDIPSEWYYDPSSKELYFWAPQGVNPSTLDLRGKVQSYAFSADRCSNFQLRGLDFFATTVSILNSKNMVIEDCNFTYPSYSKRMLGELEPIDVTEVKMGGKDGGMSYNSIINCHFSYADDTALDMSGGGNLLENCSFYAIDYSCIGGATINVHNSYESTLRANTISWCGNSATLQPGIRTIIEYNNISNTGFLQNDGALIQMRANNTDGTVARNNWTHNSIKTGLRFDNVNQPDADYGKNGTIANNVSWNVDRGGFFKGDEHFVYNNTMFNCHQKDLIIASDVKIQGLNYKTITRNNICNTLTGHQKHSLDRFPVRGIVDHNWVGVDETADIRSQLRDPDNLDFRPRKGSKLIDQGELVDGKEIIFSGKAPDVGAYEYGEENYWIAGHKADKASIAIPLDKTQTAKADADLMWQPAYKSSEFKVFVGDSPSSLKQVSTQNNNIYTPAKPFEKGKTYYWRVDCDGENGLSKGDIWSFTVEPDGVAILID